MKIIERELTLERKGLKPGQSVMPWLHEAVTQHLADGEEPIRFVVTSSDESNLVCEVGVAETGSPTNTESLFSFRKRPYEIAEEFNAVFLVPTGVGAEIGGHSGDAGAVGKLLASACDHLITHPNVGNAADINELPANAFYVEGSVIADLLMGSIGLAKVRSNRILLLMEEHPDPWFMDATVNMASAARAAAGMDISRVVVLEKNFLMRSMYAASGRAVGQVEGMNTVYSTLDRWREEFDAVAVASLIKVPSHFHTDYFADTEDEMVNPWGGVEAMLTHTLSRRYRVPTAHAPMMTSREVQTLDFGPVDPRKAAEPVSATYLFSVLKGLHRSPRIIPTPEVVTPGVFSAQNLHCLVIPDGCVGLPTLAALEQGIPVIAVRGNRNRMTNKLENLPFAPGKLIFVDNYLEAAGVMTALRTGVSLESVRRPLAHTRVTRGQETSSSHGAAPVHRVH